MEKLHKYIEEILLNYPDYRITEFNLEKYYKDISINKDIFIINTSYRLLRNLNGVREGKNSWEDFLSALRNYILFNSKKIKVSSVIAKELSKIKNDFAIDIDGNEINALHSYPNWLENSDSLIDIFRLKEKRISYSLVGDGTLKELTGFSQYASISQKVSIFIAKYMPEGSTLLICLPTGGGKSLVGQYLTFLDSPPSLTLVIVPTIALAMDQERASNCLFRKLKNRKLVAKAYHGGLSQDFKKSIKQDIKNGKISILYISPEAIISSDFNEILIEIARNGILKRLIIDEAHIVVDWGDTFRTDFQFLYILRNKLLEESDYKIQTILFSATYTERTVQILKSLFSNNPNTEWLEVRGDKLRPEPVYYYDISDTSEERINKIKELMPFLPRPLIIYVTSPKDADNWYKNLKSFGFRNLDVFTGKTNSVDRQRIINDWSSNKIDVIIATSAFGMGVDKSDVRAILHCCFPESLNRFYQEVGRGGRDGMQTLSLLSIVKKEDREKSFNLVNKKVLTSEKLLKRWIKMVSDNINKIAGNSFWVDTDVKPDHIDKEHIVGLRNASWNEYVLLFLKRHGLIELLEIKINKLKKRFEILVLLKDVDLFLNKQLLEKKIEFLRNEDWKYIENDFRNIDLLVKQPRKICWSERIFNIYSKSAKSCGGCPYCRHRNIDSFTSEDVMEFHIGKNFFPTIEKAEIFKYFKEILIYLDEKMSNIEIPSKVQLILSNLFNEKVNITIINGYYLEDNNDFIDIKNINNSFYVIFRYQDINDKIIKLFENKNIILVFSNFNNDKNNNHVFKLSRKLLGINCNIVYIARKYLYLSEYKKPICELINADLLDAENFLSERGE